MKNLFMFMMASAILFSGCSKDKDNAPKEKECRITNLGKNRMFDENTVLEYDGQGRVVKISGIIHDGAYGSPRIVNELTYQSGKILVKQFENGELDDEFEFLLDGAGLIKSSTLDNGQTYTYSDGYLTKIQSGSVVANITYSNGNPSKSELLISGQSYGTDNFTYDTSESYQPFTTFFIHHFSEFFWEVECALFEAGYFGKLPKNRLASSGSRNITYENGEDGKVKRIKVVAPPALASYDVTIGYTCD